MNAWELPPIAAHAAPVLWSPNASTGERFVALIVIRYDAPTPGVSNAHVAFHLKQLKAMIGSKRATSAFGILEHVAAFMRDQMLEGAAFDDLIAPFDGFTVGKAMRIRGYSEKQVVDGAIRSLSTFGSRDSYEADGDVNRRNSIPTSQFLRYLRSSFAREDEERKARFNKRLKLHGAAEMTIDYAHGRHLVQVTSLPSSAAHLISLQKEAESKVLELDITASLLREQSAPTQPSLLVNTTSLALAVMPESKRIADELFDRLKFVSSRKGIQLLQACSPKEAAGILSELEIH